MALFSILHVPVTDQGHHHPQPVQFAGVAERVGVPLPSPTFSRPSGTASAGRSGKSLRVPRGPARGGDGRAGFPRATPAGSNLRWQHSRRPRPGVRPRSPAELRPQLDLPLDIVFIVNFKLGVCPRHVFLDKGEDGVGRMFFAARPEEQIAGPDVARAVPEHRIHGTGDFLVLSRGLGWFFRGCGRRRNQRRNRKKDNNQSLFLIHRYALVFSLLSGDFYYFEIPVSAGCVRPREWRYLNNLTRARTVARAGGEQGSSIDVDFMSLRVGNQDNLVRPQK